jgi:hypothetical protein
MVQTQKVEKDPKFAGHSNRRPIGPAKKNKAAESRGSNGTKSNPETGARFAGKQLPPHFGQAEKFSSAFKGQGRRR